MYYLIVFILLSIFMYAYLNWASKVGIIDQPNKRSSHTNPTIRGGGIVFPIAILCWGVLFDHSAWLMIISILLIGLIGFLDDRYSLHQIPRLTVQSISVIILLYFLGYSEFNLIILFFGFILITGWLNTFNFMDGINGISVLYAISVLAGIYMFSENIPGIPMSLYYVLIIALIIFGFLNIRKKAIVFAGDVGSLTLGLIIAYLVTSLIIETGRLEFILFLSVYGVDSVLTIVHRLFKRENIFEAHRSHLYQYLANELEYSHAFIASVYSALQFGIILGLKFISFELLAIYSLITLSILISLYILIKYIILNKIDKV